MKTKFMLRDHFSVINNDFKCLHCQHPVSANSLVSGVHNRNHCPYCLWSRHMDLHRPGDRLAACRAGMRPVGLTLKKTGKKYGPGTGELMLIHLCHDCGKVSINRIAADDDPEMILTIFENSAHLDRQVHLLFALQGIQALQRSDRRTVQAQIMGQN